MGRTLLALAILLALSIVAGAGNGDVPLPPGQIARALGHRVLPRIVPPPVDDPAAGLSGDTVSGIVWELRLPRVLLAALVGASLSVAGVALQGLLGNPLADPFLVGVSAGASVGAGAAILLGVAAALGGLALPLCAFGAALGTMAVVFALARVGGRLHTASVLLSGVVAGSFLSALMNLLLALAGQDQARILQWLLGYFGDADWRRVALLFPVTLLGAILFAASGRGLDAFSFGEDTARSVGVEVERFKAGVLALSALMTAVAVAVSGIIGFVGLVVPHIGRSLIGPPHRPLVPVAALLGATLTVLADLIARTLRPGEGLPVGVVTALLGAPFFCYLLRRQVVTQ